MWPMGTHGPDGGPPDPGRLRAWAPGSPPAPSPSSSRDVEGSTKLLHELGAERYADALAEHRRVVRRGVRTARRRRGRHAGRRVLLRVPDRAGCARRRSRDDRRRSRPGPIQVRIGLHTGTPLVTEEGYVGDDVHLAARVAAAGHGGQVLALGSDRRARRIERRSTDLGEHRLKDIDGPVRDLPARRRRVPAAEDDLEHEPAARRRARSSAGSASSRRCVAPDRGRRAPPHADRTRRLRQDAARASRPRPRSSPTSRRASSGSGLATLRDPALVTETIAQTLGAKDGLAEHIGEREMLLLLDNLEQVIDGRARARRRCSPPARTSRCSSRAASSCACRARSSTPCRRSPSTTPSRSSASARSSSRRDEIAELCARLDDAAARGRARRRAHEGALARADPRPALAAARPAQGRPRRRPAPADAARDDRVVATTCSRPTSSGSSAASPSSPAAARSRRPRRSPTPTSTRSSRSSRRASCASRRSATGCSRRSASSRPSGSTPSESEDAATAAPRLHRRARRGERAAAPHRRRERGVGATSRPDYANVRAAVSYALDAREPDDVGRILGAIYPFLISHGHLAEVRDWGEAALAVRRPALRPRARARALVGGGEIARFAGDLDRAIELKEELASVDDDLQRPNWKAATLADLCEIALDLGDLEASAPLRRAERGGRRRRARRAVLRRARATARAISPPAESHGRPRRSPAWTTAPSTTHACSSCSARLRDGRAMSPERASGSATGCGRSSRSATAAGSPTASKASRASRPPMVTRIAPAGFSAQPNACVRPGGEGPSGPTSRRLAFPPWHGRKVAR